MKSIFEWEWKDLMEFVNEGNLPLPGQLHSQHFNSFHVAHFVASSRSLLNKNKYFNSTWLMVYTGMVTF